MGKAFWLGAIGYPALEILYRGRTHYAMGIAGGLSAILIKRFSRSRQSILAKSILCGAGITAVEYICGTIWNRRYQIWDYRRQPVNYRGQICLPFSMLWCGLSAFALILMSHMDKQTDSD